ncbi:ATP-binding protein [Desulfuromonas sp. TF]|uniref:ATP-binding protein n=1 Tax=Desulfuromonas sp. TF TaxID=1232410 RepID=UPI0012DF5C97|nr:ATP-binding protein [Desulfuromonas sp. TF]
MRTELLPPFGRTLLLLGLFLLYSACPVSVSAHAGEHKDVLILHSYHPGLPWTDSIMAGMRGVLKGRDDIHLHIEYLDTLRYTSPDYATYILDAIFHYKLEERRFDLILLSDNPALSFVLKHRDDLFLDTPIVFCGINNFHPSMVAGFPEVTGVAEYPSYRETIETALHLHPGTTEVVVIGGFANITSRQNRQMIQSVLTENDFPAGFTFWDDIPIEELTDRMAELPADTLVLLNGSVALRSGRILSYEEGMRALRAACPRPIYSFWDFFLGEGIVGGKLVNGREQGKVAARMALRVLAGEDPDRIPVVAESNRFMFDYRELRRFSLSMRRLPPGSVLVHEPSPFYALSREELWIIIGIMTALTLVLGFSVVLLRRAKSAVGREKERVDLLLTSTAEAIYGLDLEGSCTFCNPAALRLLGYHDESELLGKPIHSLIHHTRADGSPYPSNECRISEVLRKDVAIHGEDEILWRADGTSFPIEYWSHPIKGKEKIGALVTFLDISDRKRAEAERERALQELNAFVYTVSHDLRSPLTAIIGFSDFLLEQQKSTQLDENARVALAEIQKQAERMSAMMEDLLELARVGKLPRPAEAVDAGKVLQEVLQELGSQIADAGLHIRTEPLPSVHIPPTFLAQVFSNLIGNAIRYAGPQGGPIEIGGTRIMGKARFFVRDHGPGVPERERDRIFDVFFRGSTGEKIAGTGIGLATVKKIAQFYAGASWVEETPGGGATFWVELGDRERPNPRESRPSAEPSQ